MTNQIKTDGPDLAERINRAMTDSINHYESTGDALGAGDRVRADVRALTAPIEAELAELRAFAERFPKTADGVRIVPGMNVWANSIRWYVSGVGELVAFINNGENYVLANHCYSTEAAMLAAKDGK